MQNSVYITEMTEQHLEETTRLLLGSFMTLNPIWKQYNYRY
jgi:hypothetical protein